MAADGPSQLAYAPLLSGASQVTGAPLLSDASQVTGAPLPSGASQAAVVIPAPAPVMILPAEAACFPAAGAALCLI